MSGVLAAVDATKAIEVAKRFKIEGYPTGNSLAWRLKHYLKLPVCFFFVSQVSANILHVCPCKYCMENNNHTFSHYQLCRSFSIFPQLNIKFFFSPIFIFSEILQVSLNFNFFGSSSCYRV